MTMTGVSLIMGTTEPQQNASRRDAILTKKKIKHTGLANVCLYARKDIA